MERSGEDHGKAAIKVMGRPWESRGETVESHEILCPRFCVNPDKTTDWKDQTHKRNLTKRPLSGNVQSSSDDQNLRSSFLLCMFGSSVGLFVGLFEFTFVICCYKSVSCFRDIRCSTATGNWTAVRFLTFAWISFRFLAFFLLPPRYREYQDPERGGMVPSVREDSRLFAHGGN